MVSIKAWLACPLLLVACSGGDGKLNILGGEPTGGAPPSSTGGAGGGRTTGRSTQPGLGGRGSGVGGSVVGPIRGLDLVFMLDNSIGMTAKQAKLKARFPKMLEALKNPATGNLPDLHIAIIDSDLGTGGAYPDGSSCGRNQNNNMSPFGDKGRFQMPGATKCGITDDNALFLDYANGKPVNFTGDLNTAFACLASGLGTSGCGEEHQLQAFEWALINLGKDVGNEDQIHAFLRPLAMLALVFLTDEDDCSAATNDGLFGVSPGGVNLSDESASLRCATRAHACNGRNLSAPLPGYPTRGAFTANFADCEARTDSCPNPTNLTEPSTMGVTDTSNPDLPCSPLKDVKLLADEIKTLKPDEPDKIMVAGIFGWPRKGEAPLPYKIDLVPNPSYTLGTTAKDMIYDYWPVCYDPNFLPKGGTNAYDPVAFGNSATGGVRLSAFIDQFGANGLKYSICEPDFADVMTGIGAAIASKLGSY